MTKGAEHPRARQARIAHAHRFREWLDARVPVLERRVRVRLFDFLIERCPLVEEPPDHPVELEREMIQSLLVGLSRLELELETATRSFDTLARAHATAPHHRARMRIVEDWIDGHVDGPARRRADHRAAARHLDVDAVRERYAVRTHRLSSAHELGLKALAAAFPRLGADPERLRECVMALVVDGGLDVWLGERITRPWRWHRRLAAARALRALARTLATAGLADVISPSVLRASVDLAGAADDHPWIQACALDTVAIVDPEAGMTLLGGRALRRREGTRRDDFVTRRLIVRMLFDRPGPRSRLVLRDMLARDPSEHVRLGIAADAGAEDLDLLLDATGAGAREEASPRVRARAALSLLEVAVSTNEHADAALEMIAQVVARDGSELVFEVVCGFVTAHPRSFATRLGDRALELALEQVVRASDRSAALHEHAAGALEALTTVSEDDRAAWTEQLRAVARSLPLGGRVRVPLASLPATPSGVPLEIWIGRVLAVLSRADYGLAATIRGSTLVLHRGERRRRRLWRIVHELRNRAPNKRQAFLHTTARTRPGMLRAPPGRLDEITATVVPGERLFVETEGGWGRHLPRVEDVLDATAQRTPVRVFSSFGTTSIIPPRGLVRRLWLRLRLSLGYARFARLRTAALAEREAGRRGAFVGALGELGLQLRFDPWAGPSGAPLASPHASSLFPTGEA